MLVGVFERFTDEARNVVVYAQEEARAVCHNYIGTEHLLLGLLRDPGSGAAQALTANGVTADAALGAMEKFVSRGEEASTGQIPFTPRAKRSLELAQREALSLGAVQVAPEHVLLGLIRTDDGVAQQILGELGVDLAGLREALLERLPSRGAEPGRVVEVERSRLGRRGLRLSTGAPPAPGEMSFHVQASAEVRLLLMRAGARALEAGRTEITVADIRDALRGRDEPGEAAVG
jgi:ATP-dependent Clp protease ATP-binding subunit ClpA